MEQDDAHANKDILSFRCSEHFGLGFEVGSAVEVYKDPTLHDSPRRECTEVAAKGQESFVSHTFLNVLPSAECSTQFSKPGREDVVLSPDNISPQHANAVWTEQLD